MYNRNAEQEIGRDASSSRIPLDARVDCVDVPCHIIDRLIADQSSYCIKQFDKDTKEVIIVMASVPHEIAADIGAGMVEWALQRAGMATAMLRTRCAQALFMTKEKRGRRPDASYIIRNQYLTEGNVDAPSDRWPHIVIEVGFSEKRDKLLKSIVEWLTHPSNAVRMAMTLNIEGDKIEIAVYTVAPTEGFLDFKGRMIAIAGPHGYEMDMQHSKASLKVPFNTLFLRDSNAANGELDIIITAADFLEISHELLGDHSLSEAFEARGPELRRPFAKVEDAENLISVEDFLMEREPDNNNKSPVFDDSNEPQQSSQKPVSFTPAYPHDEWEVDEIVDCRATAAGDIEYKATFKGHWPAWNSNPPWQHWSDFTNSRAKIMAFHARHPGMPQPPSHFLEPS
ncbi:hypothetical protein KEM56_001126 [Ascosphaera pollenicola]|nr:hypothetical protein KEM56_001126 [Ascosphaera pollenicola]